MKLIKNVGLTVSAIALATAASFTYADVDDVARGGLRHLKLNLADTLDDMQEAIGANTTGVQNNATAAAQNASNISDNSAAISANGAAINALQPVTYDYRDYGRAANVTGKTYNIRNIATCDTETRSYVSTPNAANPDITDITMTRVRTEAGLPCRYHKFKFQHTPEGRFRVGLESYNRSGSRLNSTVDLHKPMIMRTSNMQIGQDMGDGTTTTFVDLNLPGVTFAPGNFIQKTVLLGVDSVKVPLNGDTTLDGCLRYHVTHESTYGFGTGPIDRIEYHCPGLGMVKRIQANGGYYELNSVTYQ